MKMALLEELVPQLARAIAPGCEVVLHDARTRPATIRAIGNAHVTGRGVGDFMTLIAIDDVEEATVTEPLYNYISPTPSGARARVSVLPIRHEGEIIGWIAVNFLVEDLLTAQQAISFLVQSEHPGQRIRETFLANRSPAAAFDECLGAFGRAASQLGRAERIALVGQLRERGVFALRGAVDDVAQRMGVSRTTIYNYLALVEGEGSTGPEAAKT